jgi:serine protease Do
MKKTRILVGLAAGMCFLLVAVASQARMSPRQIYKSKAPGVVLIVASPEGSSSASAGTGSIINENGTIITNCHVIFNESKKAPFEVVHVFLKPKRVTGNMNKDLKRHFNAEVLAYDKGLDLALLKIKKPPADLTVITLGDPEELGPGDETIAIGHPEQGGLWTITTGVIGTQFEDFKGIPGKHVFQMETSLNRGNSGGPLFDVRGYQIGVNTAIARKGEGGVAITGVNFAVKSSVAKKFASKHNVTLAYGSEKLTYEDTRVATAEQPPPKHTPTQPTPPPPPPKETKEGGKTTYKDPESGGTLVVEDDTPEEGREVTPRETGDETDVRRKFKRPKRKPLKFKKHYRVRPRPYSYRRLFTKVDKIRGRAQEAFDDLDREIMRRRR